MSTPARSKCLPPRRGDGIDNLIDGGGAVLRIVVLIADGRVAGDVDQAEARVSRIAGGERQPHRAIRIGPAVLLVDARRDACEPEPEIVQQAGRKRVRLAHHGVLRTAGDVVAVAGNLGERRAGERLIQRTVGEAVANRQIVAGRQVVVHPDIEMIFAVAQGGGRDVVPGGRNAIRFRIQCRDRPSHRVLVIARQDVVR